MSLTALFIIALFYWVYTLQNKITNLEKLVNTFKDISKQEDVPKKVAVALKSIDEDITEDINEEVKDEVIESSIQSFKETHTPQLHSSKFFTFIHNYFTQGNILVRIGGVILFFGLAFLVKYASEHSIISMQIRLVGIAIAAIGILIMGWKLRDKEGAYGLILQGLGISMLYLVVFSASKFYGLLTLDMAFGLMLLIVLLGSFLAIKENALPLALFATGGGFLVPILTSSGDGSHVMLFGYYVVLNLGIFIIAWYKSWRLLNLTGFLFTFIIGTIWGVLRYHSELFSTTEPFLIIFFLMYIVISILYSIKYSFNGNNFVDSTLVFGLPLVAFPIQISLVHLYPNGSSYSAIAVGTLYAILFGFLKNKIQMHLLSQAFLALSVVFYTISIAYVFEADVSAALWSLESAALIWVSLKQNRKYGRYFGSFLLFLSVLVYIDKIPLFYSLGLMEYVGYLIITTSLFIASYLLDKYLSLLGKYEYYLPRIFLILGLTLGLISTIFKLQNEELQTFQAALLSLTLGGFFLFMVTKWLHWKRLVEALQFILPLGMSFFFLDTINSITPSHPFRGWGVLILSTFMTLNYLFLYHFNTLWKWIKPLHILSLLLLVFIFTVELYYHATMLQMGTTLPNISLVIFALLFSIGLLVIKRYPKWLLPYLKEYQLYGVGTLILFDMLWEVNMLGFASDFKSLPYIALLNPLDLMQLLGLCIAGYWIFYQRDIFTHSIKTLFSAILAFVSFLFSTAVLARYIHHSQEIAYTIPDIWQNIYFQTGLSILWSLIAIVFMFLSKHYAHR
ncbi:MAG: DUF2339 domain-containing protein, partial [Epsilonproteobacteria bacterium]|nr:DUF2339 domain-containing protein [Campylobacterota bacterium]